MIEEKGMAETREMEGERRMEEKRRAKDKREAGEERRVEEKRKVEEERGVEERRGMTDAKRREKEMERKETGTLKGLKQLAAEEDGMGTVEVILIIVVLVGLVILFRDQITKIVNNLFNKITTQTEKM